MGVVLVAGAVSNWGDPDYTNAWRVMPALAGLLFIALTGVLLTSVLVRPRKNIERLLALSAGEAGITLVATRYGDVMLFIFALVSMVTAAAGAVFAEGGWQVVLALLGASLLPLVMAIMTALRRPRWIQLSPEGIESSALRSHTQITWEGLTFAHLPVMAAEIQPVGAQA